MTKFNILNNKGQRKILFTSLPLFIALSLFLLLSFRAEKFNIKNYGKGISHIESHVGYVKIKGSSTLNSDQNSFKTKAYIPFGFNVEIKLKGCMEKVKINGNSNFLQLYCGQKKLLSRQDFQNKFNTENITISGLLIPKKNNAPHIKMYLKLHPFVRYLFIFLLTISAWIAISLSNIVRKFFSRVSIVPIYVLCLLYAFKTFYFQRGHDTDAHIDYIQYFAQHLAIPAASKGWEFHQAPLYYAISGLFSRIAHEIHFPYYATIELVQLLSILSFIGIAYFTFKIATVFFHKKADVNARLLFSWLLLTVPSLMFLSGRITNNSLYHLCAFALLFSILLWWKTDKKQYLLIASVLFALTYITRLSVIVFVPVIASCFIWKLYKQRINLKTGVIGLGIIIILSAWLPALRFSEPSNTKSVFNLGTHMQSALNVDNSLRSLTTFNPYQVVSIPYNNPWSDKHRRSFFWEYYYKSAFFGEFTFAERTKLMAQSILLFSFLIFPILCMGLWKARRDTFFVPMILLLGSIICTALLYRMQSGTAPSQDFRYNIIALVPIAYFIAHGMIASRKHAFYIPLIIPTIGIVCMNVAFLFFL